MSKQYFSDDEQFSSGFVPNVKKKLHDNEYEQYKKQVKNSSRMRQKMADNKKNWE